jgi:ATP-dependent RNA helicase DDX46/PRP5
MTEEEVEEVRRSLGDIKVRGQDLVRPIFSWHHCGLNKKLLDLLEARLAFKGPFPIQCQAIPVIMSGRDMIGIAETGSGKTLAYVLPMLRHIADQESLKPGDGPIAVIMVPTRELAGQVHSTVKLFARVLGVNVSAVYGGRSIGSQISDLRKGVEVVVCTPGRMIEVLATSANRLINLDRTTFVVIDEADRMFDFGFEPQITKILSIIRPTRQTVMFSATFPNNVAVLARRVLTRPIEVVVGTRGQICRAVDQSIEIVEPDFKIFRLLELLGLWLDKGSVIIFVDKQEQGDDLYTKLVKHRYTPLLVHGAQDQEDRESTLSEFRTRPNQILIATSLLARGLDVHNVVLVVNYFAPTHKEEYTHRVGRTGRAGRKGTSVTFITKEEDQFAGDLIEVLQMSGAAIPESLLELHKEFKKKVHRGEVREFKNKNLGGRGFNFDPEEAAKMRSVQRLLSQAYGLKGDDLDEGAEEDEELMKLQSSKKMEKERLKLINDPRTLEDIKRAAMKASSDAIKIGGNSEQVLQAAQNAIRDFLLQYNPEMRGRAKDKSLKVENELFNYDNMGGKVSTEFDINDYPEATRRKITARDFLQRVEDFSTTQITLRGVLTKPGVKSAFGQKRLHLHIEGDTRQNASAALYEIKRVSEESALNTLGGY